MTVAAAPSLAEVWDRLLAQSEGLTDEPMHLRFRVGEVGCHLTIHGRGLADAVLPALAGLPAVTNANAAAVDLRLWDHAATGTTLPDTVAAHRDDTLMPRFVDATSALRIDPTSTTITRANAAPTGLFTCDDAATLPHFVRAAPLPQAFAAGLAGHGLHLMHAACVGLPGLGAVLLTGRGGSGKSSTALRLLRDGWQYVGDDYVVVDPAARVAHRLYATAKVDPANLQARPDLLPTGAVVAPDPAGLDKSIAWLLPALADRVVASLPLRAVLRCTLAHRPESSWRAIPAGEALLALAPSTMLQLPTSTARPLAPMADLVRALPTFELAVGSDLTTIAPSAQALLEAVA